MKRLPKSLLPKKIAERDALNQLFLNIKPRLILKATKDLLRLKNTFTRISSVALVCVYLLGYYPVFSFPPLQRSVVLAQEVQEYEVISASFPQPIKLPHPGYLSSRFSNYHPGIDLATGLGMPIHPISSGVVEQVNFGFFGYGNHIIVDHQNGFKSLYAHTGRIFVKAGQKISSSSILGEVGLTGHTSGPHTHLEVTHNGQYINPLTILPKVADYPTSNLLSRPLL